MYLLTSLCQQKASCSLFSLLAMTPFFLHLFDSISLLSFPLTSCLFSEMGPADWAVSSGYGSEIALKLIISNYRAGFNRGIFYFVTLLLCALIAAITVAIMAALIAVVPLSYVQFFSLFSSFICRWRPSMYMSLCVRVCVCVCVCGNLAAAPASGELETEEWGK